MAEVKYEEERGSAMPEQGCSEAAGLMVLLIENDPGSLIDLESKLKSLKYGVANCRWAMDALSLLKKSGKIFDIVLSSFNMPDMNGYELLERIGRVEVDIPIIMMSTENKKDIIRHSVMHGARDFLIKPIGGEVIQSLWKHVIKQKHNGRLTKMGSIEDVEPELKQSHRCGLTSSLNIKVYAKLKRPRGEEAGVYDTDDILTPKKSRLVWSADLHQKFVTVVTQLGTDKATPSTILRLMNVPGLTRANIASHLQKYRLKIQNLGGASQNQSGLTTPLTSIHDASKDLISPQNGCRPQSSVELSHQILGIQAPRIERSNASSSTEEVNLDSNSPTNIELEQLLSFESPTWEFSYNSINPPEGNPGFVDSLPDPTMMQWWTSLQDIE